MQTLNTAFERILQRLVDEEIEKARNDLSAGHLPDYAEYRFQAGKIAGMRQVLGYFDEVNKILAEN